MTWRREAASLVLLLAVMTSKEAFAEGIRFFDEGTIDYWSKPGNARDVDPEAPAASVDMQQPDNRPAFDWERVMDPRNDEFFKEGDYTPPAPFMEVARDPSDHNIRMWRAYIERKNALAARLEQRLQEYSAKNDTSPTVTSPQVGTLATTQTAPQDPKRFRVRMYFDSMCPHCERMMSTLTDLAERGFAVEAMQIDDRPLATQSLPFPIAHASQEEVQRHGISSVPFLLVGDLQDEVVYKMTGFKTASEIFEEISAGMRGGVRP